MSTRLPLSPYCNPLSAPSIDSLGVFHPKAYRLLASFARMISRSNNAYRLATTLHVCPLSQHTHSRQATLHVARDSAHHLAGSSQLVCEEASNILEFSTSSHNTGSPRKPGRILHAIGVRPESLTPSTHPKLGVKSRHQRLHRYALHRIFRPYLEAGSSD